MSREARLNRRHIASLPSRDEIQHEMELMRARDNRKTGMLNHLLQTGSLATSILAQVHPGTKENEAVFGKARGFLLAVLDAATATIPFAFSTDEPDDDEENEDEEVPA